ncbi:unnamed protein product [Closterium sp. NIES-64]|nr:unnamed protein product [Closterium sp. NIES-64]
MLPPLFHILRPLPISSSPPISSVPFPYAPSPSICSVPFPNPPSPSHMLRPLPICSVPFPYALSPSHMLRPLPICSVPFPYAPSPSQSSVPSQILRPLPICSVPFPYAPSPPICSVPFPYAPSPSHILRPLPICSCPPVQEVVTVPSSSFPIAAVVVPVVVVVLVLLLTVFLWRRWRSERLARMLRKEIGSEWGGEEGGGGGCSRVFSLAELRRATKEWQAEIGRGGYGSVYKAVLKDKTVVAVKRLDVVRRSGAEWGGARGSETEATGSSFARWSSLSAHHRHLVNLLGFCAEKEERALVYEYMGLGSLFDHLHDRHPRGSPAVAPSSPPPPHSPLPTFLPGPHAKETPLSWDSRIKIAIHVALGIDYLHYGADPPLIHRGAGAQGGRGAGGQGRRGAGTQGGRGAGGAGLPTIHCDIKSGNILLSEDGLAKVADLGLDIKSGNILLSEDGLAKVADFGLCKEVPVDVTPEGQPQLLPPPTTAVRGSFGYLDPEYVSTSLLTDKSDVYSYGVVLLELLSGKYAIHEKQPLAYWVSGNT